MICPNCGTDTEGKFCYNCGARMPVPEPVVDAQPDEAPRQAEPAAAYAEPEPPVPEEPVQSGVPTPSFPSGQAAPKQGYNPYPNQNPGYPQQGYAPSQAAPIQGQIPSQAAQNQGYAPGQAAQNQGYVPSQAAQNQGYAPGQAAPNQGYAPYQAAPNQGYIPAQGFNPAPQSSGEGFRSPTPEEIGKTDASQLVRKLGSSGPFLIGVILSTISFLVSLVANIRAIPVYLNLMDYYVGTDYEVQLSGTLAAVLFSLVSTAVCVLLLWLIFGAACSKRKPRMGTGALTTFKVFFIIGLVGVCIALLFVVIAGLIAVFSVNDGSLSYALAEGINSILGQYGLQLALPQLSDQLILYILIGTAALFLVIAIIFIAKILKTINTAKRVVRTGRPDDRVSIFAAILIILGAAFSVFSAVSTLVTSASSGLMAGIAGLLAAVGAICFAAVIFKFRSGMRRLGVRRGVMSR